jgi:hypothetical protein
MAKSYRPTSVQPSVGIVWGLRVGRVPMVLVADRTPLAEAEPYGDYLTHPRGHYDVWEAWRRLGLTGLAYRGLPPGIVWHEYEYFPRGRVVFETRARRFVLYATASCGRHPYCRGCCAASASTRPAARSARTRITAPLAANNLLWRGSHDS